MSTPAPDGASKDWMEIWYETGEITWQKPLPSEAEARILGLFERLVNEQDENEGGE